MKNRKKILCVILLLVLFTVTGCTKYVKNSDNKVVTNEKTGQQLVSNILCRPTEENMFKLYQDNSVNLDSLPECTNFTVGSNGYEGLWTTIFVKPLAWVIIQFTKLVK